MVGKICLDNFPIYHFAPVSSSEQRAELASDNLLTSQPSSRQTRLGWNQTMWQLLAKPDIGLWSLYLYNDLSLPCVSSYLQALPKPVSLLISDPVRWRETK